MSASSKDPDKPSTPPTSPPRPKPDPGLESVEQKDLKPAPKKPSGLKADPRLSSTTSRMEMPFADRRLKSVETRRVILRPARTAKKGRKRPK